MTLLTTEGGANAGAGNPGGGGAGGAGSSGVSSGGSSGTGAAPAGGSGSGGGTAPTWRDSLPEDIRGNATLTKFTDVNALAKSYIDIQGLIGKKGVFPPGEKATPEQWKEFYKNVGQPDFEKFQLKAPEGKELNPKVSDGFRKMAHESGLLPHQAQGLMDWFIGQEDALKAERLSAADVQTKTDHANLKKEWGEGYDKQLSAARLAVKELGGEDLQTYLEESGLGNNTRIVKLLAKAGALLGEDKIRGEGGGHFGQTPQEIQNRIDQIRGDTKGPYFDRTHAGHAGAVREMEQLYQKLSAGQKQG